MVARGDLGVEIAARSGAAAAEPDRRLRAPVRQAGGGRDPDARIDDRQRRPRHGPRSATSPTAIYDGADAVMLSAESAAGKYPVEAVAMMDRIARSAERDPMYPARIHFTETAVEPTTADALAGAARADRSDDLGQGDGLLHQLGLDRAADRARAAAGANPGDDRSAHDGAADGAAMGRPRGPHPRRRELRGNGRQGEAHGASPRHRRSPASGW